MNKTVRQLLISSLLCSALPTLAADDYAWGNVRLDGGGFVDGIATSKTEEGLIYIRTDVGGVYRWNASTYRWIPLTDWISELDVGLLGAESIALDPQNSNRVYVLAGTSYFSKGKTVVMRSSDYGETWDTTDVTSLFKAHGNGMGRQTGEKLAVDPQNDNVVYCGSRNAGIFRSLDAGKSWSQVDTIGTVANADLVNANGTSFILFDPSSGQTDGKTSRIIAGIARTSRNLFISNDAGSKFEAISGAPAQLPMRAVLANGSLYITFSSSNGPHSVSGGSVWKYNLEAKTWTNITPKDGSTYFGSGGQSYAHGFGGITVDPTNTQRLMISTINFYGGNQGTDTTKWSGPWGDQLFQTTDGGATWSKIFNNKSKLDPNGSSWVTGKALHWVGSLEYDPFHPARALAVSGNGVFMTEDSKATAQVWKFQSKGIEETVPLDIVSIPGGPLVTAIGDYDGAAYKNIGESTPTHSPNIGTTHSLGYAPLVGHMLRAGQVTTYTATGSTTADVMYYSEDKGTSWSKAPTVKGTHGFLAMSADGKAWFHKPENTTTFWRSIDKGTTWSEVTGLGSQSQYAPIVADPVNANVLYLLDNMGDMYASSDKGASFAKVGSVVDNAKNLYSSSNMKIRTVPGREGHLWVPLDQAQAWVSGGYSQNGLAFSDDGGASFVRFPAVRICVAIGLGKAAEGASYETLYMWGATTDGPLGIYRSTDKGASWERINDDKHQFGGPGNGSFVVGDFNVFGRVYMSSAGRGLIYGNIGGLVANLAPTIAGHTGVATLQAEKGWLNIDLGGYSHGVLRIVDSQGKAILTQRIDSRLSRVSLQGLPQGSLYARLQSGKNQLATLRLP